MGDPRSITLKDGVSKKYRTNEVRKAALFIPNIFKKLAKMRADIAAGKKVNVSKIFSKAETEYIRQLPSNDEDMMTFLQHIREDEEIQAAMPESSDPHPSDPMRPELQQPDRSPPLDPSRRRGDLQSDPTTLGKARAGEEELKEEEVERLNLLGYDERGELMIRKQKLEMELDEFSRVSLVLLRDMGEEYNKFVKEGDDEIIPFGEDGDGLEPQEKVGDLVRELDKDNKLSDDEVDDIVREAIDIEGDDIVSATVEQLKRNLLKFFYGWHIPEEKTQERDLAERQVETLEDEALAGEDDEGDEITGALNEGDESGSRRSSTSDISMHSDDFEEEK